MLQTEIVISGIFLLKIFPIQISLHTLENMRVALSYMIQEMMSGIYIIWIMPPCVLRQTLDQQLGTHTLNSYVHRIGYGNEQIDGELSSYWLESSLKISIIEQIELLTKLYNNRFLFADANINAVKNAICLSNSNNGNLYGKTGTGRINGKNISGWFVGYIETSENVYFFATHIQADQDADGIKASEISLSILSDMGIWKE